MCCRLLLYFVSLRRHSAFRLMELMRQHCSTDTSTPLLPPGAAPTVLALAVAQVPPSCPLRWQMKPPSCPSTPLPPAPRSTSPRQSWSAPPRPCCTHCQRKLSWAGKGEAAMLGGGVHGPVPRDGDLRLTRPGLQDLSAYYGLQAPQRQGGTGSA